MESPFGAVNLPTKLDIRVTTYVLVFLITCFYFVFPSKRQKYSPGVPIAGLRPGESLKHARERFRGEAKQMLLEGYQKNKGKPFYVPSPLGERLMLPPDYVEEIKTKPVGDFDFVGTFFEMFEGQYTTMGDRSTLHPRVAKAQLNHYLGDVLPEVMHEIVEAFEMHLPPCEDWTELRMPEPFVKIVARVTSRMFGGTQLSKNDDWVHSTIKFAEDGFIGAQTIKRVPVILRPLAAKLIPALRRIKIHHRNARAAIFPMLEQRELSAKKPVDFLQWMTDDAKGHEQAKDFLAMIQLKLSFAAIHTSAAAPMQLLYDLCSMPEYVEPLREEISSVLEKHGSFTKAALAELVKLDSIMKESQRFNPLLLSRSFPSPSTQNLSSKYLVTMERIVTCEYRLDDGFIIPKGTQVGVPAQAISMDPDIFPDPEKFDGFRFAKMQQQEDIAGARTQYAASNKESMAFGYGRHACPGRFFAAAEIKMIMAYMLMNYDFHFPQTSTDRPPSLPVETQYLPNQEAVVLLKKRSPEKRWIPFS
ncbi:MAG: hypothetical protein M1822_004714 [Bathelium mastoideum]|nr:MAG: hypothetical protein M1822_004714 [Bathelium mastoideum]